MEEAVKLGFFETIGLNLSGGIPSGDWASMFIFYLLGMVLTIGLDIVARSNKDKPLSLKYWLSDKNNQVRIAIMPVAAFIAIRFVSSWFPIFSQNMEFATILGLVGDTLFIAIRAIRKKFRKKLINEADEKDEENG